MENNLKFNSAICTSRSQSERLLSLGLKEETADMVHFFSQSLAQDWTIVPLADGETAKHIQGLEIPAWSLHRLIEIVAQTQYPYYVISKELPIYDALCERIEWLIKEGYFNKEYLEE